MRTKPTNPRLTRHGDVSRRRLIAAGFATVAAPSVLRVITANAQSTNVNVGYISPHSGPDASFGEADGFIVDQVNAALQAGLSLGGKIHQVEIISADSQSSNAGATQATSDLILHHGVNLIAASTTPNTLAAVAEAAQAHAVPCITTNCPWQAYYGNNDTRANGAAWSYHFFWGLEDLVTAYPPMWDGVPTNKTVGALFPNSAEATAWSNAQRSLLTALVAAGYRVLDPGPYAPGKGDFTPQITQFMSAGVEIVVGSMVATDFTEFWPQAGHHGFFPKICTISRALLFPSLVGALGARGDRLSTDIWWTPDFPFKSGLTGQSARQFADAYTRSTGRPWTQPMGYQHALFEVAIDALRRAKSPDRQAIREAIAATDYRSMVGPVRFASQPVDNVSKTPLVAGQWQRKDGNLDLVITENKSATQIPVSGKLEPLS